jgi:hypothetical protein
MANNIEKFKICVVLVILLVTEQVNSQNSVSFDITDFYTRSSSINLSGSARISRNGNLELSDPNDPTLLVGNGSYKTLVPIWNRTTGIVASFTTKFSFVLEDIDPSIPAGGALFFVIDKPNTGNDTAAFRYVAVKFQEQDPGFVGIDVNTGISLKTSKWKRVSQTLVDVIIGYDSVSKILTVAVTDSDGQFLTVSQVVDVKEVLPEIVRLRFSSSTSEPVNQLHSIQSWSFTSNLKTNIFSTTTSNNIRTYE